MAVRKVICKSRQRRVYTEGLASDIRLESNSTGIDLIGKNGYVIPAVPELGPGGTGGSGRGMNCRLIRQDPEVELQEWNMHKQIHEIVILPEDSISDNGCRAV